MRQKKRDQRPWDIKVLTTNPAPAEYIVEIKVTFTDNKLREKMRNISNAHFAVTFKTYWFKKGIKSARAHKTDRPTKTSQPYSSKMKYTFDSSEKAALFAQGIERALDIFIMENILEEKQFKQNSEAK